MNRYNCVSTLRWPIGSFSSFLLTRKPIIATSIARIDDHGGGYRWFLTRTTTTSASTAASQNNNSSKSSNKIITNYDQYLSKTCQKRQPSAIRKLQPLVSQPGMISLGGGLPNKSLFPITDINFTIQDYDTTVSYNTTKNIVSRNITLTSQELDTALQYSPTLGIPELVQQLRDLQQREHNMSVTASSTSSSSSSSSSTVTTTEEIIDREVIVTVGSQDGFCKAIEMLIDNTPDSLDVIFCESPTYSGALSFLQPYCGDKLIPVETDEHGLIPDALEQALLLLEEKNKQQNSKQRKVLYTIPTAQNPSGATMSIERRYQVMKLAQEHDMMVLEDDPYYFLHPQRSQIPSLLSLDTQGRVLRFDSVSKLISSGLRIGFVTGPQPLIERIQFHIQATNLHNSGISQLMLSKILESWKVNGFETHCQRVATFYDERKQIMAKAAQKHLTGLAEWHIPEAGMFLWMKLPFHDTKALIETKAAKANVLLVPGQAFDPLDQPSSYVRASFSTATDADLDTAMERLANLIRSEMKK